MGAEGTLTPMRWIDSHNHLQFAGEGEVGPMVAAMRAAGVERCVVNATHEGDWEAVAALALSYPDMIVPAFGIHPWQAHTARLDPLRLEAAATVPWGERLRYWLGKYPSATVGECGLDGWVAEPGLELQAPVLLEQLRIARELHRTVSIHCVRAWGRLIEAFAVEAPPPKFLLHAYAGSLETARRLLPRGAYFSCSGSILHPRKAALLDIFRQLPRQRILLETDAPESLPKPGEVSHAAAGKRDDPADLAAMGAGLAGAFGMRTEELAELTSDNARECFGW